MSKPKPKDRKRFIATIGTRSSDGKVCLEDIVFHDHKPYRRHCWVGNAPFKEFGKGERVTFTAIPAYYRKGSRFKPTLVKINKVGGVK